MLCYNLINYAITFFHHIYFYRIQSKTASTSTDFSVSTESKGEGRGEVGKRLTFRCNRRAKNSKTCFKWRTLTLFYTQRVSAMGEEN
jgi:hypothetical protein